MSFKNVIYPLGISLLLMLAYQNCSEVGFSPGKEALVEKVSIDDDDLGDGYPLDPVSEAEHDGDKKKRKDHKDCKDANHNHDHDEEGDDDNSRRYVCILEGPGKSIKVGYVNSELLGKTATPQDVCMSKKACLEIISQKFFVKGAEKRGFCPDKNPHVIEMSDETIQLLVDQI